MIEQSLIERIVDLAVEIQQIAAPTFHEHKRAEFLYRRFMSEGLEDVEIDKTGNVYARLPGREPALSLVISAHTDTVFQPSTDLHIVRQDDRISGPGIGDNSLGVAGLFGLVWALRSSEISLPGDLWLVANVGEEGLGNLRGIQAVVDRFGKAPLAYLVLEGLALGQVYHRGLKVRRYRICVRTPGGHSWVDFGRPSAVHVLADLVVHLLAIPLPGKPRTTLNVGVIAGGTSVNTIAPTAHLELDLRSEDPQTLDWLTGEVDSLARGANGPDITVTTEVIGERPGGEIAADHPLVRLAVDCLSSQGLEARLSVGSTDANLPLSCGLPSICIGLSSGGGAHTETEHLTITPIAQGLDQLICLVQRAFQELPQAPASRRAGARRSPGRPARRAKPATG